MELLDKDRRYIVWAPDECRWIFRYRHGSWIAYRPRPGDEYLEYQGVWSEVEAFDRINRYSHKLDEEDRYDILFFCYLGGLETLLEENKDG